MTRFAAVRPPRFLLSSDGPLWRYVLRGWLLAFLPVLVLLPVVAAVVPGKAPDFGGMPFSILVIYGIIVAPLLETVLMAGWLIVALRFVRPVLAIVSSAMVWGVVHAISSLPQGLIVWWPFAVFSSAFVTWRRHGNNRGLQAAAGIHALYNASIFGLAAIAR